VGIRDVRGAGLFLAVEIAAKGTGRRGGLHPAWPRVERIWKALRRDGIRVTTNNDGSSLMVCPPFVVTADKVDGLVARLGKLVQQDRS